MSAFEAQEPLGAKTTVSRLRAVRTSALEIAKARLRAIWKRAEISAVTIAPGLAQARHVVVTTIHNEAARIPYILTYYRAMGFEQFIVIDNRSTDDIQTLLRNEAGISIFTANGSFRNSRFGYDWVNFVLAKYCHRKWVLYIDADEFLVFPDCDTMGIAELTSYMERTGQDSMQCLMLDMYSDKTAAENIYRPGQDPLTICRFYDRDGYKTRYGPITETTWIKGGVRGRLYFQHDLTAGPALNKTPLVFWKKHYAFLKATHELWPPRLNGGPASLAGLRGVLLHFKFLSDWTSKLSNEFLRKQHTEEYNSYVSTDGSPAVEPNFIGPPSTEYTTWRSLQHNGLLNPAPWAGGRDS